jgi:phosphomannomutase
MINVSPIGRNCSYQERLDFEAYDKQHSIRAKMVEALQRAFPDYGLKYSIGGQISIDAFPIGWDKTFCLRHVKGAGFREIHFFGDKTAEGGNDYEIFHHPSVLGHTVTDPSDTMRQLNTLFFNH